MRRAVASSLAVAYVALIAFCVSRSDEEPTGAFILISSGGSLLATASMRVMAFRIEEVPRPWWWWLVAAIVAVVAGLSASAVDASNLAAVAIGLAAGVFAASTLTPAFFTAPSNR